MLSIVSIHSYAQTSLTNTSQIGFVSQIMIADAATAATVPIGTTGTGLLWDCSNLIKDASTPVINFTISSPAGTVYAADYPNANWYSSDPVLSAVVGHNYYTLNTDSFVSWGHHIAGNSYEIYDDPEAELVFPLAYNQTKTNTYSKTNYNSNGSVSSYQTGLITMTYEGNGTLKLPAGTFNDVAKVKRVRTNSLGATTTSYVWFWAATGEQLLYYDALSNNQVIYKYGAPTSIINAQIENQQCTFDMYGRISIHASQPITQITVLSIDGKKVYTNNEMHPTDYSFTLPELNNGIYFVNYVTNKQVHTQKIIVNR